MDEPIEETLDLVRGAQSGNERALNDLLQRYYPRVLKIVRLRMGDRLRRRMESSDVLQETFAHAVRNFDKFEMRSEASLINWLARVAENRLLSAYENLQAGKRNPDREVAPPGGAGDATDAPLKADTLIPLDKVIQSEEGHVVERCLQSLPEQYREVVILRNYAGLSFREIADETGRPSEGAARMMHAKAMVELSERVKNHLTDQA